MKASYKIITGTFVAAIFALGFAGPVQAQTGACCVYENDGGTAQRVDTDPDTGSNACVTRNNGFQCAQYTSNNFQPDTFGVFLGVDTDCGDCIQQFQLPVELTSFDALYKGGDEVALTWETASELNNAGFDLEQEVAVGQFEVVDFIEGHGTTNEPQSYEYTVSGLAAGTHVFRLKSIDFDGAFEYVGTVEVAVDLPERFVLEPVYPNPFNPTATVRFGAAVEADVAVNLYDASGKLVRTLFEGSTESGAITTVEIDGSDLTSGLYIVRLESGGFQTSQTVTLLK